MAGQEVQDDRSLVAAILAGESDRFAELVARYEKRIVNYIYRITHRYEDAHDLAQEVFVKIYMALDRYDPKYHFSTWIFRIAQNSAIDAVRKKAPIEEPLVRVDPREGGNGSGSFLPMSSLPTGRSRTRRCRRRSTRPSKASRTTIGS